MRINRLGRSLLLGATLLGATLTACADLDVTNPNQTNASQFWVTEADAIQGVNATYNGLLNLGVYARWTAFAQDIRSDIGYSDSPWGDLANFNRFILSNYNFEVNDHLWRHHWEAVFRANQAIARIPDIEMDAALRDRLVGEAKFLRALLYFNLVNLYGSERPEGSIPLITAPLLPQERPGSTPNTQVWAQIEQDLQDAQAVLPASYPAADVGRATKGAALALLGKSQLQQRKWAEAAATLQQVTGYDLVPNYADNFKDNTENNVESVFEVQFGSRAQLASGVNGLNIGKFMGPCGPSFCDGNPTRWYYEQFLASRTVDGQVDPRLDATIWYPKVGENVFGRPFEERYANGAQNKPLDSLLFWKKYTEYYAGITDQDFDSPINYRVIRYADVLLMTAEALNESGGAGAAALVNRVRARVNLPPISAALDQAAMRNAILQERLLEFGLEGQRMLDLKRHNLLDPAVLSTHDEEFEDFVVGKSEVLPIPTQETNTNPNVKQNPNW